MLHKCEQWSQLLCCHDSIQCENQFRCILGVFSLHNGPVRLYHFAVLVEKMGHVQSVQWMADCHSDHIWSHLLLNTPHPCLFHCLLLVPVQAVKDCTAPQFFGTCVTISYDSLCMFFWKTLRSDKTLSDSRQPSVNGRPFQIIASSHVTRVVSLRLAAANIIEAQTKNALCLKEEWNTSSYVLTCWHFERHRDWSQR